MNQVTNKAAGIPENKMGYMPINKLLISVALPMMLSMLTQALYNIVDSIFVSRLTEDALTAVSLAFPVQNLMIAIASGTGVGINALLSRSLGERNFSKANATACNGLFLAFLASLVFIFLGFFAKPYFTMQTNDPEIVQYGYDYLSVVMFLGFGVFGSMTFERLLQATGNSIYSMITQMSGAVVNTILDPILIFGFDMGVSGAAVATVFSQAVSALWVFWFLCSKKSIIRIRRKYLRLDKKALGPVLLLGVSPFIMQATECLVQLTFNTGMQTYGNDYYVGAMTVIFSLSQMIFLPVQGISQGAAPIISYNFGAGNIKRVKDAFRLLLICALLFTLVSAGLFVLVPGVFVALFSSDPQIQEIASFGMRIYFAGFTIFGAQLACQQTFLALGEAKISMFLALLRKVILLIPLALLLPKLGLGTTGLFLAEPISDVLAVAATVTMFRLNIGRILKRN